MKMMGRKRKNLERPVSKRGRGRRITAVLLAAALVVTSVWSGVPKSQKEAYASSDWASSYLQNLVEQGVLKGDPDGTLNPDRDITRAEFAAMLNRAFGFHEMGTSQTKFSDVKPDSWYRNDIAIAANQGYLSGTSPSTANPEGKLTREEAVSMICRAIKIDEVTADPLKFSDSEDFQNWSRGYINAATQKGFVNGYSDGTFRPSASITRGEVAKMLSDAAGTIVKTPSQVNLGYVNGNVSLTQSGAGLRNTTISGDLYITEGVGLGYVYLDNVTVLGDVIISGAGQSNKGDSSVVADGCDFKNVIINVGKGKTLSLVAQGDTVIDNTVVKSNAYLEEHNARKSAFNDVQLKGPEKTNLDLSGTFKAVRVMAPKNQLTLGKGSIEQLTVDEYGPDSTVFLEKNTSVEELYADVGTKVTGTGSISSVNITANGTDVAQMPDEVIIRPGISATVNGQHMGSVDADQSNESPKVRSGYPEVKSITSNSAEGKVMVNKPGQVYWMVKNGDDSSPDKEELKNPASVKNVVSSGKVPVTDADKEITKQLNSLKPGESYQLYVMLEDNKGALSRIRSESFTTIDNTNPKFVASYPQAEALYDTAIVGQQPTHMIKVSLVSDKDVSAYWALLKKGDPAPSADSLVAQTPPNAMLKGVNTGVKKDVLYPFLILDEPTATDSGIKLQENTPYDIYVCLKDGSGNVSTVSKLTVTTKDVTPPDFQPGYPKKGAILPTSVTIEYETTESCKLFWMVCEKDAPFPPGVVVPEIATEGGILNSDAAKQAVLTGNGAYKGLKGSQSATMNQYGSFPVNGLEKQKAYDLYMVLQDQTGNLSPVTKMIINTQDDIPPTAEMLFNGIGEGGQPSVGSPIQIQFSEPVYGVTRNATGQITSQAAFAPGPNKIPQEQMEHYVRLYDMSASTTTPVAINFSNVSFVENNGKTVMVFPSADAAASDASTSKAAIKLKSGNTYEFRLKEISDLSSNMLLIDNKIDSGWDGGKNYKSLGEFTTQAPFIELKEASIPSVVPDAAKPIDLGFEINPKILNAGDTLCYDTVLECNEDITFDLYEKAPDSDTLTQLNVKDDGHGGREPLSMDKDHYYLMHERLHKNEQDYLWQDSKFNDLKKKQYFIHFRTVGSSDDRDSWNGEVDMKVRGIAGEPKDMRALSFKGINGGTFGTDITSPGVNAKQVSNPVELPIPVYFTDNVAPAFKDSPILTPADVTMWVDVQLDKAGDVYWLLAPAGSVTSMPSSTDLENQIIHPEGSQTGVHHLDRGDVKESFAIKDLTPDQEYDFFYTAKGKNASSPVAKITKKMESVKVPVWAKGFPYSSPAGTTKVTIHARLDQASSQIKWVLRPTGNPEPSKKEIFSAETDPSSGILAAGTVQADMGQEVQFDIDGLDSNQRYDFYATAINVLIATEDVTNDQLTTVGAIKSIAPIDGTPPKIDGAPLTVLTGFNADNKFFPTFNGTLDVTFTEPVYYRIDVEQKSIPLKRGNLDGTLTPSLSLGPPVSGSTLKVLRYDDIQVGSERVCTGFQVQFTNAVKGAIIQFPYNIWDQTNDAGKIIQFKLDVKGTSDDGYEGTEFVPVNPGK